ncbi:hypothetical protein J6590_055262 [Homalodisca vitripennis]|nr:hypothetical protein J6590_055262 [Homalodisca vitripennis]
MRQRATGKRGQGAGSIHTVTVVVHVTTTPVSIADDLIQCQDLQPHSFIHFSSQPFHSYSPQITLVPQYDNWKNMMKVEDAAGFGLVFQEDVGETVTRSKKTMVAARFHMA